MNTRLITPLRSVPVWMLAGLLFISGTHRSLAQALPNPVCPGSPVFYFDFVANPVTDTTFGNVVRGGSCCAGFPGSDNNCINVVVRVPPSIAGAQIDIISGAGAGGSFFASADCGPLQPAAGQPICLNNSSTQIDTVNVTFCKPGANLNVYRITTFARPTFPDDTVAVGCSDTMRVLGLVSPITWQSVFPGAAGQYNSLLSCTTCQQPTFTPNATTPALVRYRVCGNIQLSGCLGQTSICDTVDITVIPTWNNSPDVNICQPTTTANLGTPPANASWFFVSGPATPTVNGSTGAVSNLTANGTYNFVLRRTNNNGICTDTVAIIRSAKPNAGTDQFVCAPQTTASLGSSGGNTWSFLSGPAAASVHPTSGAVTGMSANGFYLFILGSGSCTDTVQVERRAQPASPTATNNGPLCVGDNLNLFATTVPSATYSWVGPATFASAAQNPTINNVTTANAGTYKVVSIVNSCSSDTASTTVSIFAIPADPSVSSNSPVCENDTIKLFATGSGGATYNWTGPGGYNSTQQNPIRLNATSAMAGTYCATQTVNGCTSSPQACTNVVVNPKPVISAAVGANPTTCSGSDGTITLGGLTAGVNYNINYQKNAVSQIPVNQTASGSGTVVISGLTAGTYSNFVVTVSSNGCTSNAFAGPVILTDPATPAAPTVSSNSPVCFGNTIQLFASGPGTSFSWTGPGFNSTQQNPTRSNATHAMEGNYCATQTVNNCVSSQACTFVDIDSLPVVNAGTGFEVCDGSCVQIGGSPTATSGTPGYNYSWSGGALPVANPSVCPNTSTLYTVTVTDSHGCSATSNTVVTVNQRPTADAGNDQTLVACSSTGVNIGGTPTASGGAGGYTYLWAPGAGLSSTTTANPLVQGIGSDQCYTVLVTDSKGCTAQDGVCVTVTGGSFSVVIIPNTSITWCAETAGSVTLTALATSGTPSYTYAWTGPNLSPLNQANATANPSTPGTYIYGVVVTDATGCQAGDTISVTVHPSPSADAGADKTYAPCSPNSVTIGGAVTGSGGTPPYIYSWSPAPGLSSTTVPNPTVSGITVTTTYTVTVTDSLGCTATDAVLVTVVNNPPSVSISANSSTEWCNGSNGSTNLTANITGGTSPFTFAWSGSPISQTNTQTVNVNPNLTGTYIYTVTVTDDFNCTATASRAITVNPNPIAEAGPNDTICNGNSSVLGDSPTATGGTSPYTYSWSGGASPFANPTVNPIITTTYSLTVTDSKGCTATDGTTVVVNPVPSANAGPDQTIVNCIGDSVTLGANPTASGGTVPYTYSWSPLTGLNSGSVANPVATGIVSNQTYCVTVTDVNGCSSVDCAFVTVQQSTLQAQTAPAASFCAGSVTPYNVGGSPTALGGTPAYSYSWSPATGLSATNIANPLATPTVTTTYCVTVTDANGCTSSACVTITVNPLPTANAGNDTSLCSGSCVVLGASPTGSGGTGALTYTWTPGTGLNSSSIANPTSCPGSTTAYSVTVTDSRGCSASDNITITINPKPVANADGPYLVTTCTGDSVQLGDFPAATGGTGTLTCLWSPPTGLDNPNLCNPYFKGSTPGIYFYTLTVTDVNGCSDNDVARVTVTDGNLSVYPGSGGAYCSGSGGCVTLGGPLYGGEAPFSFAWSSNPPGFSSSVPHPIVCPTVTTTYCLTVTDANGCTAVACDTVTVNPTPVADAGPDTTICNGTSVRLGGSPTASGGTPGFVINYTYSWSIGIGLDSTNAANPTATPPFTISYNVVVTDARGCTATDGATVTVRAKPTADAGPDKSLIACSSDSVQIGGSPAGSGGGGGLTCLWTPAGGLSDSSNCNPWVKNLGSSVTYTLRVTDQFGCFAEDQVSVIVTNPNLTAEAGNDVSFCQGASVSITLGGVPTAVGGTPNYTYAWSSNPPGFSSNVANPIISPTVTTTVTVVVTDANGCVASDTVKITVNPRPTVEAGPNDTVCSGACVVLGGSPTAFGGTGSLSYSWTPVNPTGNFSTATDIPNPVACPINNTTYTVVVTDSIGCSNSDNVIIRTWQNPVAHAGNDQTAVACENSCVVLGALPSATGGTPGYFYAWAPTTGMNNSGLPNPTVCNLSADVCYTLTVTDINGCTATDVVCVTVTQPTLTANAGIDRNLCASNTACVQLGGSPSATGGTPAYTYTWSPVTGICTGSAPSNANPFVLPNTTTIYILNVSDVNGCTAADTATVTVYPPIVVVPANDTTICSGGSASLCVQVSGGVSPYTYSWSPGTGLNSTTSACPVATPSGTTTYCVTITDAVNCTASVCITITVNPRPVADAGPDQTILDCSGSFAILGGSPTGSGGSGNFSYSWSPTNNLITATSANPIVIGLTTTTTYCVTVTDNATGCTASDCATITVNPSTLQANAGPASLNFCPGPGCILIGGTPTATGGTPPYSYQWGPGVVQSVSNPCVSPTVTTTYYVTVTDALGCFAIDSITIVVSPQITACAGPDTAICFGQCVTLGCAIPATGGTPPLTYFWAGGAFPANSPNPTACPTSSTTYTLVVTDAFGCSATDQVNVVVRPLPIANAGPDGSIYACSEDSIILGGSPSATGTCSPYTYSWTPTFNLSLRCDTCPNPILDSLGNHTLFTLCVTDCNGCSACDDVYVQVIPPTIFIEIDPVPPLCSNNLSCVTLNSTVTGGVPPYVYNWSAGATPANAADPVVCPTVTSTYEVTVTDSKSCQAYATAQVTVNPPPVASISGLNSQYCISNPPVTLTGIPSGGTFSSNGPGMSGTTFSPGVAGIGTWQITYRYTDPLTGCTDDTTMTVIVDSLPQLSVSGYNSEYCKNDSCITLVPNPTGGTFTGPGISGYTFCPGNGNSGVGSAGNDTIRYSYTDPIAGCSNTLTFIIHVNNNPTITIAGPSAVCQGQTATLTATSPGNSISWQVQGGANLGSNNPLTVTPVGPTYCVIGTAANAASQCIARDTICIQVNPLPVVNILGLNSQYCVDDACVTLTGSPSGGFFSGPGVSGTQFCPANAGSPGVKCITYTYTDGNGCTDDTTICVMVNPQPTVTVSGFNPEYCPTDPPVQVTGTPGPGTFGPQPAISTTGLFDPALAAPGVNTLTYYYQNPVTGCDTTIQFTIRIKPKPTITVTPTADTVCRGQSAVLCPNFSLDVVNIQWVACVSGNVIGAGLGCITIPPPPVMDYCVKARALSNNGCYDSVIINIHTNQPPVAVNDSASTCEEEQITIDVLGNDTDPEGDALFISCDTASNGTTTVVGGMIVYTPVQNFNGTDTLTYCVCNVQCPNDCDTGIVIIDVCPVNDTPVAPDVSTSTCRDSVLLVCPPVSDVDGDALTFDIINCGAVNGTAVVSGNNCITYTPTTGFVGVATICYVVCDPSEACDTGTITIDVAPCNHPPVAVDDNAGRLCDSQCKDISVLVNDSDPDAGDVLTVVSVVLPGPNYGSVTITGGVVTYCPGTVIGPVTLSYVISDNGNPAMRDTANILIDVIDCVEQPPTPDTVCAGSSVNVCIEGFVGTAPYVISFDPDCNPQNGTAAVTTDSCFTYTPNQGFIGNDVFCVYILDQDGNRDTAEVTVTVIDCNIDANDEPCDSTETPMNTPITIDVLANDVIPVTGVITVTIVDSCGISNGTAVVNSNNTITVTPAAGYEGPINFCYEVCATNGSFVYCDIAAVCVDVIDTTCFIPNAFSPNGDGVNDEFIIKCNENYPNATLRIYDRWGMEVWHSNGHYLDDFAGKNMQGTELPDGTYYLIYDYKDGSGKVEAKFVVIHR